MKTLAKRLTKLEQSLQCKRSAESHDPTARVLQRVSDDELELLKAAVEAHEQGRELTDAELAAVQAYEGALESEVRRFADRSC